MAEARSALAMIGHLHLVAAAGEGGRTHLRRQSFAPPIHVSKPHHDAGWLVVNLASPTPGLFAGDQVEVNVAVGCGARLLLTAPSANRLHAMKEGHAELRQHFRVAAGGCLDVWPEYLIPQAESAYRQRTRIEVEEGGTLFWTETLAPGRTAKGEVFAFRELRFATDIFHAGQHLARERYGLTPSTLGALRKRFPQAYYASVVCVAAAPMAPSFPQDDDLDRWWIGASRLSASATVVKIVAAESPDLRAAVERVRGILQAAAGVAAPGLRRVTGAPGSFASSPGS